jgi:hypothetical protein
VAGLSGGIAYRTARTNAGSNLDVSRANLEGELKKIQEQMDEQQVALERGRIADLRQRFLTPLRYYAGALARRLADLDTKLHSDEHQKVRDWFKLIKDHVTRDQLKHDYEAWCYYEGIFSVTTLYYTCSYFFCARELRFGRPFADSRALFSERLDGYLARVTEAFAGTGMWDTSQEVIGERFTKNGSKLTYAEMCSEHEAAETFRRAPFFRPLDFYWQDLNVGKTLEIKASLDELVHFLDKHDPQTYGLHRDPDIHEQSAV